MKKALAILLTVVMAISSMAISAYADTQNHEFYIPIQANSLYPNQYESARLKENSSSVYISFMYATDVYVENVVSSFLLSVYAGSPLTNCTGTPSSSNWNVPVRIAIGAKGYVKNWAYETYGYGAPVQIYGSPYSNSDVGVACGDWSPDSVYESDTINYN